MKILFLVVLMSWYFGGISNKPIVQKVVSSSQEAAILVWEKRQSVTYPEPEQYEAHLYEIDLVKMTIEEIDIPKVSFDSKLKK